MNKDQFSQISYLVIETNSSCNLKCVSCNRESLKSKGLRAEKYLNLEEFKQRLHKFKNCKVDTIKLEGISEPMLHKEFHLMAQELRSCFESAFVIIATNCQYQLTKTRFLETLAYVDMVYLSIDGVATNYERLRLGARWDRLIQFLDDVNSHVEEEVRRKKLFINFTLTSENIDDLKEIYKLKEKYSLAGVRINLAQNWNEDQVNTNNFDREFINKAKEYKEDIKGVAGWDYHNCFWPYEGIVVDVFGDVRQCLINTSQQALCNIDVDDIREFYNNSNHYINTREMLSQDRPTKNCENCDYKLLSSALKEILGDEEAFSSPRKFTKC